MQSPEEELIKTELDYITSLEYIINSYYIPLEKWFNILLNQFNDNKNNNNSNNNNNTNNNNDDNILFDILINKNINIVDKLFKNIKQLLELHKFLYNELLHIKDNKIEIVKVFNKYAQSLIFYNDYIINSENSRKLLTKLKQDQR